MTKSPDVFLQHILESIELIERRMKGITFQEFDESIDLQDMITRRLEIIGEAVRKLPQDFRQKHSDINWQDPADMRSVLIHNYLEADLNVIWDTIKNDLPSFKEQIKQLLQEQKE